MIETIKKIEALPDDGEHDGGVFAYNQTGKAERLDVADLKKLVAAVPRWIPVEQRVPDDDGPVPVTYALDERGPFVGTAEYFEETPEDDACWLVTGVSVDAVVLARLDLEPYVQPEESGAGRG